MVHSDLVCVFLNHDNVVIFIVPVLYVMKSQIRIIMFNSPTVRAINLTPSSCKLFQIRRIDFPNIDWRGIDRIFNISIPIVEFFDPDSIIVAVADWMPSASPSSRCQTSPLRPDQQDYRMDIWVIWSSRLLRKELLDNTK